MVDAINNDDTVVARFVAVSQLYISLDWVTGTLCHNNNLRPGTNAGPLACRLVLLSRVKLIPQINISNSNCNMPIHFCKHAIYFKEGLAYVVMRRGGHHSSYAVLDHDI